MALHVIVGKGPVGMTTAAELVARGHEVRVLSRSGGHVHRRRSSTAGSTPPTPRRSTAAARGAAALYNAVNPAYHRWATDWPPVAAALLAAAERTGAVLVTMSNLYGYGRPSGPMTPETPLAATDVKGRVRIRMWTDALAAHEAGRVRVTEARAADFVGPQVPADHSHLVRQLPTLRRGGARLRRRRPGRPAELGVPARRRRDAGDPRHRRARAGPRVARAQQPAALAAAGPRRPRRRPGRRPGAGDRHPVAGPAGGGRRRPDDA